MSSVKKTVIIDDFKYYVVFKHSPKLFSSRGFDITIIHDEEIVYSRRNFHPGEMTYKEAVEKLVKQTHEEILEKNNSDQEIKDLLTELKEWDGVIEV